MKITRPYYEILTPIDREDILKRIETAGRTCYKSEEKITSESAPKFVKAILQYLMEDRSVYDTNNNFKIK